MQCINNTNYTRYNRAKLTELCGVDAKTFRKYFEELVSAGHLIVEDGKTHIRSPHIILDDAKGCGTYKALAQFGHEHIPRNIRFREILKDRPPQIRNYEGYLHKV